MCLVAMEPLSGFLLVEQYQAHRDAPTWNTVVASALDGLPVRVTQSTSDEAKGIRAHARDGLGAHHSPDLMHLQQDLHQATSLPLQTQVQQALEHQQQAEDNHLQAQLDRFLWDRRRPGQPSRPDFEAQIDTAKEQKEQARAATLECRQRQEQTRQAIRGLGDAYHPFDSTNGVALSVEELQGRLGERVAVVAEAADEAGVSTQSQKKIVRVRRLLPELVATLAWWWLQVRRLMEAQDWTAGQRELFQGKVLAWTYWEQASQRGRDAAHRRRLRELAERCREEVEASVEWQGLSPLEQGRMKEVARQSAGRWVRSSSCVEGRNAVLRLRHHGKHGLSQKTLTVLTVLHNYWIVREDGTTAAERFFGRKPDDLFQWLLARFPQVPRPAKSRKKPA
jgi:hypothetical protein